MLSISMRSNAVARSNVTDKPVALSASAILTVPFPFILPLGVPMADASHSLDNTNPPREVRCWVCDWFVPPGKGVQLSLKNGMSVIICAHCATLAMQAKREKEG